MAKIKECQAKMEEFLTSRKSALMEKLREKKELTTEIVDELKTSLADFMKSYKA
ncbi:MAG: hypothetical protein R3F31_05710 [Verrucomicrobiales bacterium]